MKKRAFAVLTAMFMAVQCMAGIPFSELDPVQLTAQAEFEDAISSETAGLTIDALSVKINGTELTADTVVKTGDQLSLDFAWKLPTNFTYVNGTFYVDLADKLNGISLGDQTINVGDIARYAIRGNRLYIELFTGSSGREGSCELQGTINVDEARS
ncbi:MAG: hypothetical protein IJO91_03885, partial [Oscillospiraceae bacterium]|nr:hypothetical protein [Oscillospiraceae bacterium]